MSDLSETDIKLLKAAEQALLQPGVRKDPEHLSSLLADDFQEVGKSGKTFTRADIIDALQDETPMEIHGSGFQFIALSKHCVLVRYQTRLGTETAERASVWQKQAGTWRLRYHQGTPVKP